MTENNFVPKLQKILFTLQFTNMFKFIQQKSLKKIIDYKAQYRGCVCDI